MFGFIRNGFLMSAASVALLAATSLGASVPEPKSCCQKHSLCCARGYDCCRKHPAKCCALGYACCDAHPAPCCATK